LFITTCIEKQYTRSLSKITAGQVTYIVNNADKIDNALLFFNAVRFSNLEFLITGCKKIDNLLDLLLILELLQKHSDNLCRLQQCHERLFLLDQKRLKQPRSPWAVWSSIGRCTLQKVDSIEHTEGMLSSNQQQTAHHDKIILVSK